MSKADRERERRVVFLHSELRDLQGLASDRSRSADSKAGFLAVTSGIVVGAGPLLSFPKLEWWVSGVPLVLAIAAICLAILALRVRPRPNTSGKKLADTWKDTGRSAFELLELSVNYRARDIQATEDATSSRIRFTKIGLLLLFFAMASIAVLFVIENSIK